MAVIEARPDGSLPEKGSEEEQTFQERKGAFVENMVVHFISTRPCATNQRLITENFKCCIYSCVKNVQACLNYCDVELQSCFLLMLTLALEQILINITMKFSKFKWFDKCNILFSLNSNISVRKNTHQYHNEIYIIIHFIYIETY